MSSNKEKVEAKIVAITGMPAEFLTQLQKLRMEKNVVQEILGTQCIEVPVPNLSGLHTKPMSQLQVMCSGVVVYTEKDETK